MKGINSISYRTALRVRPGWEGPEMHTVDAVVSNVSSAALTSLQQGPNFFWNGHRFKWMSLRTTGIPDRCPDS
jgi:hypothetical protein